MNSIEKRVKEIKSLLDKFDDELEKYQYIITLGKKLLPFNEEDKISKNIVHGCTSQVWLVHEQKHNKFVFNGTSDAKIVNGLIYIITYIFSNSTIEELKQTDIDIIYELELSETLTPNRQSGIIGMIKKINEEINIIQ